MKKYVISAIILIIGLGLIGWKVYSDRNANPIAASTVEENFTTSTSTPATSTPPVLSNKDGEKKDEAWNILQQYLAFAKVGNIAGVASLSYQVSDSCKNTASSTDCLAKIKNVYNIGSQFKKTDFGAIIYDDKQTILYSGWNPMEGQGIAGFARKVIYFAKDSSGQLKLLSFNPSDGIFISTSGLKNDEITKKLQAKLVDTDKDMITDDQENCVNQDPGCAKTNPNKRDTDGNGYWDGVQVLFYK